MLIDGKYPTGWMRVRAILRNLSIPCLALILFLPSTRLQAHISGFTDTSIQIAQPGIRLVFTTPIDNLLQLPYDIRATDNGATPARYLPAVISGFDLEVGGLPCTVIHREAHYLETLKSAQFRLEYHCPQPMNALLVRYHLFFDANGSHRNIVRLLMAGKRLTFTLDNANREMKIAVGELLKQWGRSLSPRFWGDDPNRKLKTKESAQGSIPAAPAQRYSVVAQKSADSSATAGQSLFPALNPAFFRLGVEHILTGYDHILFVVALLLIPASLSRLAGLITAFTVAHSLTLGLSVFDIVTLPPAVTEPLIALSIVYVALGDWRLLSAVRAGDRWVENLRARKSRRWLVTFGFGLIHGFGFSYILREMGLGQDRASALLLFNLGVEAGQMAIVLALYPLLHLLIFRQPWGRRAVRGAAWGISLLAGFWLLERVGLVSL